MAKVLTGHTGTIPVTTADSREAKHGFWSRLFQSIQLSRQRAAEREIAKLISARGGQLTDDLEREISRRFGGPAGT